MEKRPIPDGWPTKASLDGNEIDLAAAIDTLDAWDLSRVEIETEDGIVQPFRFGWNIETELEHSEDGALIL